MSHYILDGKTPRPATLAEYMRWRLNNDRLVARAEVGKANEIEVITHFLGVPPLTYGQPLLFESLIIGGDHDGRLDRCSTWEQAEEMHARAVMIARGEMVPE